MKCPNCGNEMQEGHLICEVCGYEHRIVPDYDPSADIQIDDVNIGAETKIDYDNVPADPDASNLDNTATIDLKVLHTRAIVVTGIVIAAIVIVIGGLFAVLHNNSLEHQLNKVRAKAESGNIEAAISSLENLYVHYPDNSEILFMEADYYESQGKTDQAIDTLRRMLRNDGYSEDDIYTVYDRLIELYSEENDYEAIDSLLDECEYSDVVTTYQNYLAMEPEFSVPGGEYSDVVRLKLSANTQGKIYYTLDGTLPNETSSVYAGPIQLETGEYVVSAMFMNIYGMESQTVTQDYVITASRPSEPVVNYDSGDYSDPCLIMVDVPEGSEVYYTTDRSIPTIDSIPYTGPIQMPLSTSNFSFIAINDNGLCSDVVVRSYRLTFPGGISSNEAVNILKQCLIGKGMLNDMTGKSDRAPGTYTYAVSSALRIEGSGDYYLIYEQYHDDAGNIVTSDTLYLVNIYDSSVCRLGGDMVNGFTALAF